MKTKLVTLSVAAVMAVSALATPLTFDFKDPKGVNNAVFKLDAPLEAIPGSASGVSGTVTFDPAHPGATIGKIVVDAATLTVPNPMMKEHLHGPMWLDVTKNKEITFEAKELKNVRTTGDSTTADASGALTIKGVAKDVTVPVSLTFLPGKLGQRVPKMEGDLLVIRAKFTVRRSDFGINPGAPAEKVSNEIELTLSIAGAAPKR